MRSNAKAIGLWITRPVLLQGGGSYRKVTWKASRAAEMSLEA